MLIRVLEKNDVEITRTLNTGVLKSGQRGAAGLVFVDKRGGGENGKHWEEEIGFREPGLLRKKKEGFGFSEQGLATELADNSEPVIERSLGKVPVVTYVRASEADCRTHVEGGGGREGGMEEREGREGEEVEYGVADALAGSGTAEQAVGPSVGGSFKRSSRSNSKTAISALADKAFD